MALTKTELRNIMYREKIIDLLGFPQTFLFVMSAAEEKMPGKRKYIKKITQI